MLSGIDPVADGWCLPAFPPKRHSSSSAFPFNLAARNRGCSNFHLARSVYRLRTDFLGPNLATSSNAVRGQLPVADDSERSTSADYQAKAKVNRRCEVDAGAGPAARNYNERMRLPIIQRSSFEAHLTCGWQELCLSVLTARHRDSRRTGVGVSAAWNGEVAASPRPSTLSISAAAREYRSR
jgi:hypothetical protein